MNDEKCKMCIRQLTDNLNSLSLMRVGHFASIQWFSDTIIERSHQSTGEAKILVLLRSGHLGQVRPVNASEVVQPPLMTL